MNWKFWKPRPVAAFAFAVSFSFLAGTDAFAADQRYAKYDLTTLAYWDTTLATAPADTILAGFLADNAYVCVPATSACTVQWIGFNGNLLSNSGGTVVNPRKGLARFKAATQTPPASTCITYYGPPLCRGAVIGGTWTGTVIASFARVYK